MTKLHEVLAAEATVVGASDKVLAETQNKFGQHSKFFAGAVRTLKRLGSTAEDEAQEKAGRVDKPITTSVPETLDYVWPMLGKALSIKLAKHLSNQVAKADIELDSKVIIQGAPVDFLLDLEQALPKWRALFLDMPTLDPGKNWKSEGRRGVYVTAEAVNSTQTMKQVVPITLAPATDKHPAQVKEGMEEKVVGLYSDISFSGNATTDQKARAIELCDKLIVAVKTARMRANSVEIVSAPDKAKALTSLFSNIFE